MKMNVENLIKNATQVYIGNNLNFKKSLLEGKALVDVNNEVVTTIFINPKYKTEIEVQFDIEYGIWGADVNYFSDMPENTVLLFANSYDFNSDKNNDKLFSVVKF